PHTRQTGEARTSEILAPAEESKGQHSGKRAVPPRVESPAEQATSASFFDRLDVVIEAYMRKNTPADSAPRKRVKPYHLGYGFFANRWSRLAMRHPVSNTSRVICVILVKSILSTVSVGLW